MRVPSLFVLTIALMLAVAGGSAESAGGGAYTNQAAKDYMGKLAFLVGRWRGSGWILNPENEKQFFEQTERVDWRLDKTVILIEGRGVSQASGEVIHHALAMVSWQIEHGQYRFASALANGRDGNFTGYLNAKGQFVWSIESEGAIRRFTIGINEQGQWYEVGEYSTDRENWFQFFEMTLDRMR